MINRNRTKSQTMADKTLHTDIERLSNTDTDGELK